MISQNEFENRLEIVCSRLRREVSHEGGFTRPSDFETRVRETLATVLQDTDIPIDFEPHPHLFPDIVLGDFGVEVKFTTGDSWRSVANSVSESRRDQQVRIIYVIYGKMGGIPDVRWREYGDCVVHVRTSHVPRFEVDMDATESLFSKMNTDYIQFSALSFEERMEYVRAYARSRLKQGERLWWLENKPEPDHSLPLQARLYMSLPQSEKRQLRAEAALLCPVVVKPARSKHKYDDVTLYLLTYHGVLCPQARDLFSAGSVALRASESRGGNYILRALQDIEYEMIAAADHLEDALFNEYWGETVPREKRIGWWLRKADSLAETWRPSDYLFRDHAE